MSRTIEIKGMREVNQFLSHFDAKFNKKLLNRGLTKTGSILKSQMKTNLSAERGGSQLSKFVKIWQGKKTGRALKWVGYQLPKTRTKRQKARFSKVLEKQKGTSDRARRIWIMMGAYWLEFGTLGQMILPRAAGTKSLSQAEKDTGGRTAARIAPSGWFRKAVDAKSDQMVTDFSSNMEKAIVQYMRKYGW